MGWVNDIKVPPEIANIISLLITEPCRKLYLIVDGGHFSTNQKLSHTVNFKNVRHLNSPTESKRHRINVPLTIIGEYYLTAKDAAGKNPTPIHSSPYCFPRPERAHPDPPLREATAHGGGLSIVIPRAGHELVDNVDESTPKKFTVSRLSWYQYSQDIGGP